MCRWLDPLAITLPQTINPILGSIIGWMLGVSAFPDGVPTYAGGVMLLTATVIVLLSAHARAAPQQQQQQSSELEMPEVHVMSSKSSMPHLSVDRFWQDDEAADAEPASSSSSGLQIRTEAFEKTDEGHTTGQDSQLSNKDAGRGWRAGILARLRQFRARKQQIRQADSADSDQEDGLLLLPHNEHVLLDAGVAAAPLPSESTS